MSCLLPLLCVAVLAASPAHRPSEGQAAAEEEAYSTRSRLYLERGLAQLERLEQNIGALGIQRDAAAALQAAHLAARGARPADQARRYVAAVLDACTGGWHRVDCERAQLALQRLLLQVGDVLGPELQTRARRELATVAPPPPAAQIEHPWDFGETENQRIVKTARSLVGHRLAGTAESPAARAWARYAHAFLAAHRRQGWYEAESPGYLGISMTALLHLADFAPDEETGVALRVPARRHLDALFAAWAPQQVGGYPAGAKSRAYVQWALGVRNVPWPAWAWLMADVASIDAQPNLGDYPELATSPYRPPPAVPWLLRHRRELGSYEIVQGRAVDLPQRRDLDALLYSYATPDYILGAAQAIAGSRLGVSGGQEIMVTLYPEGDRFAPLYLWSRSQPPGAKRWQSAAGRDLAVAGGPRAVAQLGGDGTVGYAYLAPGWSRPRQLQASDTTLVAVAGQTRVALLTVGEWEIAPAPERFPGIYGGDKHYRGSWVAVPRRQPARIALLAAGRSQLASDEAWDEAVAGARLEASEGKLVFQDGAGGVLSFEPGVRATIDGRELERPAAPTFVTSPVLEVRDGVWTVTVNGTTQALLGGSPGDDGETPKE